MNSKLKIAISTALGTGMTVGTNIAYAVLTVPANLSTGLTDMEAKSVALITGGLTDMLVGIGLAAAFVMLIWRKAMMFISNA